MQFSNLNKQNLQDVISCIKNILNQYNLPPILIGVGNPNIFIDSVGPKVAKMCYKHIFDPIPIYGIDTPIIPDNIKTYQKHLQYINRPKIIIDSAIGTDLGNVSITNSPAIISSLCNPIKFGDVSILVTTITPNKKISTTNLINVVNELSFCICSAICNK